MSLPDPTPPRKLSRLGLYLPFGLLLVLVLGWSAAWVWARGEAARRIDLGAAALRDAGYEIGWNVGCDASSQPRALSARIWFSAAVYVDMPIGDFGPSCVDGSTGSLFMRADEP